MLKRLVCVHLPMGLVLRDLWFYCRSNSNVSSSCTTASCLSHYITDCRWVQAIKIVQYKLNKITATAEPWNNYFSKICQLGKAFQRGQADVDQTQNFQIFKLISEAVQLLTAATVQIKLLNLSKIQNKFIILIKLIE